MAEEHLMTVEEFNQAATKWALKIRAQSRSSLSRTRASGRLAILLEQFVDKESSDKPAYKIKFNFLRYGVFRAYGAGRGYVIVNGVPVRGYRVRSDSDIKKKLFGGEAKEMLENGYRTREINVAKKVDKDQRRVMIGLTGTFKQISTIWQMPYRNFMVTKLFEICSEISIKLKSS